MKSSGYYQETLFKLVNRQVFALCLIGLTFFVYQGFWEGISALVGGAIGIIPGILFGCLFLKSHHTKNKAQGILKAFYGGEVLKWVVSVSLFALAFQWRAVEAMPLFVSFIAMQAVYAWMLLI